MPKKKHNRSAQNSKPKLKNNTDLTQQSVGAKNIYTYLYHHHRQLQAWSSDNQQFADLARPKINKNPVQNISTKSIRNQEIAM